MVKDKGFFTMYPTPNELSAPVSDRVVEYPYEYDFFANFHCTYNCMSVGIRYVGSAYRVVCRGFLPPYCRSRRLHCDNAWTLVSSHRLLAPALKEFRELVQFLFDMPDKYRRVYQEESVARIVRNV